MTRRRKPQKQPSPEFIKGIAEGVGFVIIAASQIEHMLSIAMAKMLRLTRLQHRALILPMSISTKISALRQLGNEYLNSTDNKRLKNFLTEVKDCADKRNELAHGFYGAKKGKFDLLTFSGDARLSGQPVSWDASGLGRLRNEMIAVRDKIPEIYNLFPRRLKLPKSRQPTSPFDEK